MHAIRLFRPSLTCSRFGALTAVSLLLAACNTTQQVSNTDTAAFRMERFEEMRRVQEFEKCSEEGLSLDAHARSRASTGAFLNSARVLERCGSDVAPSANAVPAQDRMRIQALATVNYFKGGDVEAARRSLNTLKSNHPGSDLYLTNGVSFIESTEVLLGKSEELRLGRFELLNVDSTLKREVRRINYWKNR